MAEFVFRDMINTKGFADQFIIASSGTSTEELGNPVHHGTKKKLLEHNISLNEKRAVQLKYSDYNNYDLFIGMDSRNITNMKKILRGDKNKKVYLMLKFSGEPRDISDPWYTGNFDATYNDVVKGCQGLLKFLDIQ